ncbi:MAG: hypothetical protein U0414_08505 [Polyangiaceae bacterium]
MSTPRGRRSERVLVACLREIAERRGLVMRCTSDDWLVTLARGEAIGRVFGYDFDLNSAVAQIVATDKAATSALLADACVPAVPHELIVHPRSAEYGAPEGTFPRALALFERWDRDVVLKPNDGTAGVGVTRARSPAELDRALHVLLGKHRAIAISPFVDVEEESRVLLLDEDCLLLYDKIRPEIVGDGVATVAELLVRALDSEPTAALAAAFEGGDGLDPREVLRPGQTVRADFRHNLAHGSRARVLAADDPRRGPLVELARSAARAIGIRLAAVDVVTPARGAPRVLEINSGVLLERFAKQAPDGRRMAVEIYDRIVSAQLHLERDGGPR